MSTSSSKTTASRQISLDADGGVLEEKPSFTTLSTEIRFMIYDYIVKGTGTISIFSQHDISKEVDATTVHLLHLNRLVRYEVQEFFYKSQTFEFRSAPALNKFVKKIGPYHASIIRKIELGDWLRRRKLENFINDITPAFRDSLRGVEKLTIPTPSQGWIRYHSVDEITLISGRSHFLEHSYGSSKFLPGLKTCAVLCASEKLASGRVYFEKKWQWETNLLFVSKTTAYPPEVEEVNPSWLVCERENEVMAEEMPGYPIYNPYPKTVKTTYEELAIPEISVMQAAIASVLAPPAEDASSPDESDFEVGVSNVDNMGDEDDGDYKKEGKRQVEERVIPDSDEVDDEE